MLKIDVLPCEIFRIFVTDLRTVLLRFLMQLRLIQGDNATIKFWNDAFLRFIDELPNEERRIPPLHSESPIG